MRGNGLRVVLLLVVLAALAGGGHALAQSGGDPGSSIDSGPSGATSDTSPTFSFSSSEPDSAFECRLEREGDPGSWERCSSPHTRQLGEGEYVFHVRAIDSAGNVDPTPASRAFTIDRNLVDTFIDAGADGLTNDPTPSFSFGSSVKGATFECRILGSGSPLPGFRDCSAPWTSPRLASGRYALLVRAVSPAGRVDRSPASRVFTVDADPPETAIVAGPEDGGATNTRTPAFRYGSEPGARFECRLDNREAQGVDTVDWARCDADGFTTPELEGGEHRFGVRAIDLAGNADRTPAERAFRVEVCEPVVRFGLVEAEARCLMPVGTADRPRWESEDGITLNGLPLPAPGPAKVVLQGPTEEDPGGSLALTFADLSVAGVDLYRGALHWKLPDGGAGDERIAKSIDLAGAQELVGMKVSGAAELRLGRRKDPAAGVPEHYAVMGLNVTLPEIFRAGPEEDALRVTGAVAIRIDKRGVDLDGLKVEAANAFLGALRVRSVCLSFVRAGGTFVVPCEAPRIDGGGQPGKLGEGGFLDCKSNIQQDRWDGGLALVLPTASQTKVGLWAGLRGGRFAYAGAQVSGLGTLLPLAPGVFLDGAALAVCVQPPPFQVKGAADVAFGPSTTGKPEALIRGSFHFRDGHAGQPWMIEVGGELFVFDKRLLEAYLKYQSTGMIDFRFLAELKLGPVVIQGGVEGWIESRPLAGAGAASAAAAAGPVARTAAVEIDPQEGGGGWIDPEEIDTRPPPGHRYGPSAPTPAGPPPSKGRFNVQGHVRVCVDGFACAGAEAVISSFGAAGCIGFDTWLGKIGVGAGYRWSNGELTWMAPSCSIGPWVVARPAAAAAQAGLAPTVTVGPREAALIVRVVGEGAPPRVTLIGPDGRRVSSPDRDGGSFVQGDHIIAENPAESATVVVVASPAAGRWRIRENPGSAPIASVDRAEVRPEPAVKAVVTGRGHRRFLTYAHAPSAGERIVFVERGPRTQQTLGSAQGVGCRDRLRGKRLEGRDVYCGAFRFNPGLGPAGRRRILAVVEQNGMPRETVVVARYRAPKPLRPAKPRKLRLRRKGSRVIVRWRGPTNAFKHNVLVRAGDGRRELLVRPGHARRAVVRGLPRRYGVRVAVKGMRLDSVVGRAAQARLRPWQNKQRRRR
jgi:hypothetical protein